MASLIIKDRNYLSIRELRDNWLNYILDTYRIVGSLVIAQTELDNAVRIATNAPRISYPKRIFISYRFKSFSKSIINFSFKLYIIFNQ